MKPSKYLQSTSAALANVPELMYKKGLLKAPLSHKLKEKRSGKLVHDKMEPMVLRSPPTGESLLRYALPIQTSKTQELTGKDQKIKMITKRLEMLVSTLEETFRLDIQGGEKQNVEPEQEEVGEDIKSFLMRCSHLAAQLEAAVKQEHNILESLSKWFHGQVSQVDEVWEQTEDFQGEEPTLLNELAVPHKKLTSGTAQILQLEQNVKELGKHRERESTTIDSENSPLVVKSYETVKQQIEDAACSVTNQLDMMLEIFEKQSNMWKRTMKERGLLEAKYKQIKSDLELLSEEKKMLENKLQRLKDPEKAKLVDDQTKKIVKIEKKKEKGKPEDSEGTMSAIKQCKMKEDFQKFQKATDDLETENKVLWEKLKAALEEAGRAKYQLDDFLNQQKAKAAMEKGKIKVTGEDSKSKLLEKKRGKSLVLAIHGQKSGDEIQGHPQISTEKTRILFEESLEKERADSVFSDVSQFQDSPKGSVQLESPSKLEADKNATLFPSRESRESEGLLSMEALPPWSKRTKLSFTEPPVPSKGDSKVDISEEELGKKAENEIDQAAKESQDTDLTPEEKSLESEAQMRKGKKRIIRLDRRKAFLLNPTSPEDMYLVSRRESEAESLIDEIYEEQDENTVPEQPEHQDAQTEMRVKKKSISKGERLSIHNEEGNENVILEHQESTSEIKPQVEMRDTSRGGSLTTRSGETEENLMQQPEDSVSKIQKGVKKHRRSKSERPSTSKEETYENLLLSPQDSTSKSEIQAKTQRTSSGEVLNTPDEVPDENLVLEHQDSGSELEIQIKEQSMSSEEISLPLEAQEKGILLENLLPEEIASLSRSDSQTKQPEAIKKESLKTQNVEEKLHGNIIPEDKAATSKSRSQAKKLPAFKMDKALSSQRVVQKTDKHLFPADSKSKDHHQVNETQIVQLEALGQDMDKLPEEGFSLQDLESALGPMDQFHRSDVKQPQRFLTKDETASEFPDSAKHLPPPSASIGDLILHLGLDKVIETDPEQLRNVFGKQLLKSEFKAQPKLLPETDTEQFSDVIGRYILKGENKTQSKSHPETTVERVTEAVGKGLRKGPVKTQFKTQTKNDTETLAELVERSVMKGSFKTQPKNQPEPDTDPMTNLVGRSTIKGPNKTQLKSHPGVNLLRNKDMLTQEDIFIKHIAPIKSRKSSFDSEVQEVVESKTNDLEDSKSGRSKKKKLSPKIVGFAHILPVVNSAAKKPNPKVLYTSRRKSAQYPYFKE
nr:coiled-coil domain-containing protein 7 isoform X2 [Oryctolagus cuniculus]